MTEDQLVEATHVDAVTTLLKPSASSEFPDVLGVRVWPRAIPQANIGHSRRLDAVRTDIFGRACYAAVSQIHSVCLPACLLCVCVCVCLTQGPHPHVNFRASLRNQSVFSGTPSCSGPTHAMVRPPGVRKASGQSKRYTCLDLPQFRHSRTNIVARASSA